jgi:hypothetical protein
MELNFDKEMDALLRRSARQETAASPAAEAHLDVDELAAFSANALPVKARARAMEHLVDCGNCRTILSNLVFFEHQEQEKPAGFAAAAAPVIKKATLIESILAFFTFPALAYGMGGLVLVFAAAFAFIAYQNNSRSDQVAQLDAPDLSKPAAVRSASSEANMPAGEPMVNSNSAMSAANTAAMTNSAIGGAFTPSAPGGAPLGYSGPSGAGAGAAPDMPKDLEKQPNKSDDNFSVDGLDKAAAPAPAPPVTTKLEDTQNRSLQQNEQNLKNQDVMRSNSNILMPDGAERDRAVKRSASEVGNGSLSREARDEKEDKTAAQAGAKAAVEAASGKPAAKKDKDKKKRKNAAANAAEAPASSPTPTPTPAKKPEDERDDKDLPAEKHPCRR